MTCKSSFLKSNLNSTPNSKSANRSDKPLDLELEAVEELESEGVVGSSGDSAGLVNEP